MAVVKLKPEEKEDVSLAVGGVAPVDAPRLRPNNVLAILPELESFFRSECGGLEFRRNSANSRFACDCETEIASFGASLFKEDAPFGGIELSDLALRNDARMGVGLALLTFRTRTVAGG